MLYQEIVARKIITVLRFRQVGSLERCETLVPELCRQYLVPKYLRRDVTFQIFKSYFHGLKEEYMERILNNAYPEKEVYPEGETIFDKKTQAIIEKNKVNNQGI